MSVEKHNICEKDYIWNPATCSCEKYLASVMDDSLIICDEVIDAEAKSKTKTNFNKKAAYKSQNLYILLEFLLITIALLIAVSIYCYLIKYPTKQKHLLPFHDTNN